MRLIAFGDSITHGEGLQDKWNFLENKGIFDGRPSKFAWPQLIANKLKIKCRNLSIGGSSNKEIWYKIMNTKFLKDDIVVILWSFHDRHCIIKPKYIKTFFKDGKQKTILVDNISQLALWRVDIDAEPHHKGTPFSESKIWFKHIHDYFDMTIEFWKHCNYIQYALQDNVRLIKHYGFEYDAFRDCPEWNKVDVTFLPFNEPINGYTEKYPLAHDNAHPGPLAHEEIANKILKEIK